MPDTTSQYNHTNQLLLSANVPLPALRVMLLDDTAAFDATHTHIDEVAGTTINADLLRAKEVAGNGWIEQGPILTGTTAEIIETRHARLISDDLVATATGGAIGPASAAVIYDGSFKRPLWFITFDHARTIDEGADFTLPFSAGIYRTADPA